MTLKIECLKAADYNPRKELKPGDKEYEKIKNSIQEFGFADPVVVNERTGEDGTYIIVGGHQRVSVAKALGYTEVPCAVVDLDEEHEKALNIALNKITGEWNKELLADLIEELQEADFDTGFTGFDPPEIEQLMNSVHDKKITEDDFDVDAELEKPAVSKEGDLWLLGPHRLVCGDSTIPETYDKLMEGKKAGLVVTDPPYNVDYEGGAGKIKNDSMAEEQFEKFLFAAYVNMEQNMAYDASIYVFHSDSHGLAFRKAFEDAGFYLSGCCIWKKQSLVLGRSPYQWIHEPCLYGWKKNGKHQWYAGRSETTVWEYDKPKKNDLHPTMKPVNLIAYPIKNSSMSSSIVLDPFGGSGSTLIACEQMDRICHTIELDPKFCDVIVNRYAEQVGSTDNIKLIRDGKEFMYKDIADFSTDKTSE
ncbi:site-specific DNA-methyltransferase [Butyrivibrio sp. MB2005]|uniref:site-specific DNA-methyltransferase n=1 Tax=Butyrivibrio sp. MB2005 TaxID=1280678 RepID=UPI00040CD77D